MHWRCAHRRQSITNWGTCALSLTPWPHVSCLMPLAVRLWGMVGLKLLITPEFIIRKSAAPLQTAQTGISLGHKMWSRLLLPSCNNTPTHSPLSIEGCFTQFLGFYVSLITFISSKKYWTMDSVFIELLSVQYLVRKYKTNSNNKAVGGRNRFSTFMEPNLIRALVGQ